MFKKNINFVNVLIILLSIVVIGINLYSLVNTSLSPVFQIITNVLFVIVFATHAIKNIKNKYGYFYLIFTLAMIIILVIKFFYK